MSTHKLTNQESNEEYNEEDTEEISSRYYRQLKVEHEKCRQEIYDLKRKLELNEAMLREVQEVNESLERSLDQQNSAKEKIIFELEEKHRNIVKEYENTILNLDTKLTNQVIEIEELRQDINKQKESKTVTVMDELKNITLEEENAALKNRVNELTVLLHEEKNRSDHAEEAIDKLKEQYNESQYICRNIKEQLAEKTKALEDALEELTMKHAVVDYSDVDPTQDLHKGNSLFAEVEDRRQNVVSKMNTLHKKYTEVKRLCKAQAAEIKVLRTERISALRKWENDMDHTLTENDELIRKYKNRISDLESKLKSVIKKNDDAEQSNSNDGSFPYFQTLLDSKKKETEELGLKIENLSTQLLVQEEVKINIAKELKHCQYKVSSLEAQVCSLQSELKLGLADDAEYNILLKEFKDLTRTNVNEMESRQQTENLNQADCEVIGQSKHERNDTHITPSNELHESEHARDTNSNKNKCLKKTVRFTGNTNTDKSNVIQKSTEACEYPIVHIS
ncbi:protein Spindly [Hylaeus volcanicus]|uniref:protein Spindly n=1 Tax=Hylaeus volcanicus TaxID=313075 RepID=UPI0023B81F57|nr:protein Spindly [Hylaeus volcanicus]